MDCLSTILTDDKFPSIRREQLQSWTAIGCKGSNGIYGKSYEENGSIADEFWQCLATYGKKACKVWVFAYWCQRVFTLLDIWEMIENGRLNLANGNHWDGDTTSATKSKFTRGACIIENPPFILDCRLDGHAFTIHIVDLQNYGFQNQATSNVSGGIARWCFDIVMRMVGILKTESFGGLVNTAASQALQAWRLSHYNHPVLCHNDQRVLSLEGDSYYGGRCEAFHVGKLTGNFYHLDVSSMYMSICANAVLPTELVGYHGEHFANERAINPLERMCIADVTIFTPEASYPYRYVDNSITIWPIGTFRTTLAGPELRDAIQHGRIIKYHRIAWYNGDALLASYANKILDLRDKYANEKAMSQYIKRIGVSIVGKLGQKNHAWVDADTNLFHEEWDQWQQRLTCGAWQKWRSIAGHTQQQLTEEFSYDAVPAVASWVTSLGRMVMNRLMRCAGRENILYCDTDAVITNHSGYHALQDGGFVHQTMPGKLKLESMYTNIEIVGIKHYAGDGKIVEAGRKLTRNDGNYSPGNVLVSGVIASSFRTHISPNVVHHIIDWKPTGTYRHGNVMADGSVCPIEIGRIVCERCHVEFNCELVKQSGSKRIICPTCERRKHGYSMVR